jgi:predicted dehydrogenase
MKPVRWGILSPAKIGMEKVLPAMMKSKQLEIVALASRDLGRAEAACRTLGIPKAYGSYEALLADPTIEAVYNPTPNHLHVPLTLQAVAAGKHVLCEKPIALNAKEAEQLRAVPQGMLVAEAFMVRHHPQWQMARDLARSRALGQVHAIQVLFSYHLLDPANVRNQADIGGGGMLDIGCYPITGARFVFEAEPSRVIALIDRDPKLKVDRLASGIADFGNGRQLTFTCGTQSMNFQRVQVLGTAGRFEIDIPFNAPPDTPALVRLHKDGKAVETIEIPVTDQYMLQAEAFGRAVRGLEPLAHGVESAIQNMKIIDAFFRSETSGAWETVT